MNTLVLVGLGGFLGSMARYSVALGFGHLLWTGYPYATLAVNILGSFLIGAALALGQGKLGVGLYSFFVPGILGGFTTYSAFAGETLLLLNAGTPLTALAYAFTTLGGGLLAAAAGFFLLR